MRKTGSTNISLSAFIIKGNLAKNSIKKKFYWLLRRILDPKLKMLKAVLHYVKN